MQAGVSAANRINRGLREQLQLGSDYKRFPDSNCSRSTLTLLETATIGYRFEIECRFLLN